MIIVQVINSLETGGAERLALSLHKGYHTRGEKSILISIAGSEYGWTETGIFSLGLSSPYDPRAFSRLAGMPEETFLENADIIHSHLFPSQLIVSLVREGKPLNGRLITTEHSTSNRRRGTVSGRLTDRLFYSLYDRIVCVSDGAAAELEYWIPDVSDRLEVISNGIDLSDFKAAGIFEDKDPLVILSVGRLSAAKNYHAAIEAFSILQGSCRTGLKYVIAGSGNLESELKELAAELGVSSNMEFPGDVKDIPALMQGADILFMPSAREGFGIAAVEAMASGLPVVASNVPGIGDVVGRDGSCGTLVNPHSPGEMAEALLNLIDNQDSARHMGLCGLKRASLFNIESTVDEYLRLYREVLDERNR
jgi:glycosyltransferase involved in cell wall biosynthesis